MRAVGRPIPRRDLPEKVTGQAPYTADLRLPGMLYGAVLRSSYPHARIRSVDTSRVLAMPGVVAVLTPFDAPDGRLAPDLPILDTEVRFVGDEVAAVAAEDEATAREALALFQVDYEPLPFVTDPREAMRPGAPAVHPGGNLVNGKPLTLTRGSVEEGFAQADLVLEDTFTTPAHSGAALEPRAVLAAWDGDRLTVWKTSRGIHQDRLNLASALGVEPEKVRVVCTNLGAGYGNKDESRLAAMAALLARRAGRPVRMEASRQEEFVAGRRRHSTITTLKVGVKRDGTITAIHATTIMDTGAYLASGPGVVRRAGQAALYLYRCPNVRYDGYLVYTNTPAAGSYRALGAPQGHFALETMMDRVAEALDMDPLEFRLKNHVGPEGQPGERTTPPGEIVDTQPVEGGVPFSSNGLRECLLKGAQAIGWDRRRAGPDDSSGVVKRGMGMAMFIYRGGPGRESTARLRLDPDGGLRLVTGVMDVGQGAATVLAQMAAEELGLPPEAVRLTAADTAETPRAPMTAGSSVTFSSGTAVRAAARRLKEALAAHASPLLGEPPEALEVADGAVRSRRDPSRSVPLAEVARRAPEPLEAEATVRPGSPDYIVNSFGAHFAEVEVDTATGQVRVLRYVAAHDSGRIINPLLARNQVEGGICQMLGWTLFEEMVTDPRTGATLNANYLDHRCPTIGEFPPVEIIFADVEDPVGPFGAKALGETPRIAVAPAVVNAIYNATGLRLRDLPASPERVLTALMLREEGLE